MIPPRALAASCHAIATPHGAGWLQRLPRHWLLIFNLILALYAGLPWLAPIFMRLGWTGAGNVVYAVYSTQCHQLPQRSYFLFGPKWMYSLAEVKAAWYETDNPLLLRQFTGSPALGWKVAWSDRMVAMYTGLLVFGLMYAGVRRWLKPLPWPLAAVLILPMVVDGSTHFVSDLAGIGQGFRDHNVWLAALTANSFAPSFYSGDAFGSFNSWMRLITGLLFGLGLVWFSYPHLDRAFRTLPDLTVGKF